MVRTIASGQAGAVSSGPISHSENVNILTVPKGSNTGTVLRLKGKGVPRRGGRGDELVKLKVMLPSEPNPELETFLTNWAPGTSYDPRRDMQP
jgi:DnaJ-class molecular chaperone